MTKTTSGQLAAVRVGCARAIIATSRGNTTAHDLEASQRTDAALSVHNETPAR